MKKLLTVFMLLLALVCALAACDEETPEHTHTYDEWSVTTVATCIAKGEETRTCSCGESETREIPISGKHTYDERNTCSACQVKLEYSKELKFKKTGKPATYLAYVEGYSDELDKITSIVVPPYYLGKPVTGLADNAFSECRSLAFVSLPDGITEIPKNAFYGCSFLGEITLPNSLTKIGVSAFQDCTSLVKVVLPDSVNSIGRSAFQGCTKLANFVVPAKVQTIPTLAFAQCKALSSVTLSPITTTIEKEAFQDCSKLSAITLPNGVTELSVGVFGGCSALSTIVLPQGIRKLGAQLFENCTSLTEITIPATVTSIASRNLFAGCENLTSVVVESGNSVYHSAANCLVETATGKVIAGANVGTLPDDGSIRIIGKYAFEGVASMEALYIPSGVRQIEEHAFFGCTNLKELHISDLAAWCGIDFLGDAAAVLVPDTYTLYLNGKKLEGRVEIPQGVTQIKPYAFYKCEGITEVILPEGVTHIRKFAFPKLESLTLPASVSHIEDQAFSVEELYISDLAAWCMMECPSETHNVHVSYLYLNDVLLEGDIVIPEGVTKIASGAFRVKNRITGVSFPSTLRTIGASAFQGCRWLYKIDFPENGVLQKISVYAFAECVSLASITIPATLTYPLDWGPFWNCHSLMEVYNLSSYTLTHNNKYPIVRSDLSEPSCVFTTAEGYQFYDDGTERYLLGYVGTQTELTLPADCNGKDYAIYSYAFSRRDWLTSVTIPSAVTELGSYAFDACGGLRSVIFKDESRAKAIKDNAFVLCQKLESVIFEGSTQLECIGERAFERCLSLTAIEIPNSVTRLEEAAFVYCRKLEFVTIPASVIYMGKAAFSGCPALRSVTFEEARGWWQTTNSSATGGNSISADDIADPAWVGMLLNSTYVNSIWYRREA